MAGGNAKGTSHKPSSSSSSHRKSRWESTPATRHSGDNKPHKPKENPAPTPKHKENPTPTSKHTASPAQPKPPSDPVPPPAAAPIPDISALAPPPQPTYGFHMLERRSIVLADGSVRSYFALPPDYRDFPHSGRPVNPAGRFLPPGPGGHAPEFGGLGIDRRLPPTGPMSPEGFPGNRDDPFGRGRHQDYWNSLGLDGRGGPAEGSLKRKYGEGEGEDEDERRGRRVEKDGGKDEFARERQHLLQYGSAGTVPNGPNWRSEYLAGTSGPYRRDVMDPSRGDELRGPKYPRVDGSFDNVSLMRHDVDQTALKRAYLHFAKLINENDSQRRLYLENGKQGRLQCVACGRSSKDFPDMHGLIMHTYNSDNADVRVDHLGLHKALCVLMGWNYSRPPDNSKVYQFLSANEAAANQDDLIMWPPVVIVHNTLTGKGRDGRMEGLGNKAMDCILRDLGFGLGKSKSLYGRDGHQGITLVKFSGDLAGLKEALRLAEFFEKENRGRKSWAQIESPNLGRDDEKNPNLVKVDEKTGERKRIFYGYLGIASDLDKVDFETRKKVVIESMGEYRPSM